MLLGHLRSSSSANLAMTSSALLAVSSDSDSRLKIILCFVKFPRYIARWRPGGLSPEINLHGSRSRIVPLPIPELHATSLSGADSYDEGPVLVDRRTWRHDSVNIFPSVRARIIEIYLT
jgi:hypothetical protein